MNKKKFAVGKFPDGMYGAFLEGPFDTIKEATEVYADEGQIIYALQLKRAPKPIRWWDEKKFEWKTFI